MHDWGYNLYNLDRDTPLLMAIFLVGVPFFRHTHGGVRHHQCYVKQGCNGMYAVYSVYVGWTVSILGFSVAGVETNYTRFTG
jgi:hypothetical protein